MMTIDRNCLSCIHFDPPSRTCRHAPPRGGAFPGVRIHDWCRLHEAVDEATLAKRQDDMASRQQEQAILADRYQKWLDQREELRRKEEEYERPFGWLARLFRL